MRASRRVLTSAVATVVAATALIGAGDVAQAQESTWRSFAGMNAGAITDGSGDCDNGGSAGGAPRDVTFTVAGVATGTPLTGVRISRLTITHGWVRDVTATLIAPDGSTEQVLFDHTGVTTGKPQGSRADLDGTYVIADLPDASDFHDNDWWYESLDDDMISPGRYRPTNATGAAVPLTAAFAGLADPNGVWTLRLVDRCTGATGSVTAATLQLKTFQDEGPCITEGMTRVSAVSDLAEREAALATARTTLTTAATAAGVATATKDAALADAATARAAAAKAKKASARAAAAVTKAVAKLKRAKKSHSKAAVAKATKALKAARATSRTQGLASRAATRALTTAQTEATALVATWSKALTDQSAAQTAYGAATTSRDTARDALEEARRHEASCLDW